jgi:aspartyl-tRNA(Asn)/glutamyl-tRNA(Gln) amidotransferase subunit C
MIDDKTLQAVLTLCKFSLSAREKEHFKEQIGDILSYVETLNQVDTEGVNPDLGKALESMSLRQDQADPGLSSKQIAGLSTHFEDSFFTVPKIIEEMDEIGEER